jgi:hypothetical protein
LQLDVPIRATTPRLEILRVIFPSKPREALLEAVLRFVDEDLAAGAK